jgi:sialidase-1
VTQSGALLAFCEGRRLSAADTGDIDLIVKRSEDGGRTWSEHQVIWDDGPNVCGNPCPVIDETTGRIWLLLTWNLGTDAEPAIINQLSRDTRHVYVTWSDDDGLTWSEPVEITDHVKMPDWTWYATGPATGIQIRYGPHAGRLIIPCDHIEAGTKKYYSHIIYSDDHGQTWQIGGRTPSDEVNECQAVELAGGRLMLNMRSYNRTRKNRAVSFSEDGGLTWSQVEHDFALVDPICQASILRCSQEGLHDKNRLLFSNPASSQARMAMTVRISYDEGKTWPVAKLLHHGPSAYSSLAVLPDGSVAILYEAGDIHYTERIAFERFSLEWLSDGRDVYEGSLPLHN